MFHQVDIKYIAFECSSLAASKVIMFYFTAVISPASWREGQKLVKMVLGPVPKLPREKDRPQPADRLSRTGGTWRPKLLLSIHATTPLSYITMLGHFMIPAADPACL